MIRPCTFILCRDHITQLISYKIMVNVYIISFSDNEYLVPQITFSTIYEFFCDLINVV